MQEDLQGSGGEQHTPPPKTNGHAAAKVQINGISARAAGEIEDIFLDWIGSDQLPDPEGYDYKNPRWDLVRALKAVNEMAELPGYQAVPIMERVLQARGLSLTDLGYPSSEEAIDDLESLWDKIKLALGEAPLAAAVRMARSHPVKFKTTRLSTKYQAFLGIAYHLQEMRGDDYIALPVVPLSRYLGVSTRRVSDYREFAKRDGFLVEVAKASWNATGPGVATKFRFYGKKAAPAVN